MTVKTVLNILGLCLNFIGTILLWKYGIPNKIDPQGAVNIICE